MVIIIFLFHFVIIIFSFGNDIFHSVTAGVCVLIAISLFGKQYESEDDVAPPEELGWSYYIAVAGSVFTALTAILLCREGFLLRNQERAYENI